MKMVLDDEFEALLHLSSISNSWETLVRSLSNSAHNSIVTISQVMRSSMV